MVFARRVRRAAARVIVASLISAGVTGLSGDAQKVASAQDANTQLPASEPTSIALPLPEDRGEAALEQALKRLDTTASVLMIVAHPDDEDGSLLTTLARGMGARCTLFTLTRGEGGQNAMSDDLDDALGVIRTNELEKADEYYGVKQLWGTEADFGFSKTQEESFSRWGHDRVLFDAVLAVRKTRPQVIVATFVGAITDGHGQHQVSGEIAQEAFKAAGDPKVFPEQLKDGLEPWQPLAVYSMVPFAPVTGGKMFDYATGKSAPAKFKNHVTGEWSTEVPSTDATIQVGTLDPALGRSYMQIAREGWGMQKSQNGGANPTLSGPGSTSYHLWGAAPQAASKAQSGKKESQRALFENGKVAIDTSISGLAALAGPNPPEWLSRGLVAIDAGVRESELNRKGRTGPDFARTLTPAYRQTLDLRSKIASSDLNAKAKADLLFELDTKINQFQDALRWALGLDLSVFRTGSSGGRGGPFRGDSADETSQSVAPGEFAESTPQRPSRTSSQSSRTRSIRATRFIENTSTTSLAFSTRRILFALVRDDCLETANLLEVMRIPVLFVSENQSAAKILRDMRSRRLHVGIVSDEFGGTAGLVTLDPCEDCRLARERHFALNLGPAMLEDGDDAAPVDLLIPGPDCRWSYLQPGDCGR